MRKSPDTISITVNATDEQGEYEETLQVPAKWAICPVCEGCGTDRGAGVECDGGGFTSSEWAEQDDDFRKDYLSGVYDRPCAECRGHAGRVLEIDREACDPATIAAYDLHQREEADYRHMCAMERRMGA